MIIYFLEENNSNFIYFFTTSQYVSRTFLFFYFPLPGIFQAWKLISSYSRFSRFSRVHGNPAVDFLQPIARIKNGENIHNYAQKCVIGIDYVRPLCNRYWYVQSSQEWCLQHVLALAHFPKIQQSGKWEQVDVSQEGGRGLGLFLWTKSTNESTFI